jgi:hypothetical protein
VTVPSTGVTEATGLPGVALNSYPAIELSRGWTELNVLGCGREINRNAVLTAADIASVQIGDLLNGVRKCDDGIECKVTA